MNQEEESHSTDKGSVEDWVGGEDLYRDPDYVEGSHPMDTDDVTWHHVWPPRMEREETRSQNRA